ncbi:hypothetical protein [Nocardioides sp.]|uniref:hypothetical protein n=1 Tax=Nocardioides sp. TaxID=35761 RepID=UPI002BF87A38|nr:hypothetical protein [Nocardioides sp.]HXH78683.1 hypothetical protein [Nocardioides sp.]
MPDRTFPLAPRSATALEVGDLIAVPCEPEGWACLQVVDVKRQGPGARTTFVAGVLPWCGADAPTRDDVSGLAATQEGLVPVEIFTEGGLQVVDQADVVETGAPSNFRDFGVGTVHKVWGWRTAIRKAQEAC